MGVLGQQTIPTGYGELRVKFEAGKPVRFEVNPSARTPNELAVLMRPAKV